MTAQVTGQLQYQALRGGAVPPVERLRDGLWCIPVPLPTASVKYVLVYALELPDGVALIDTGWRNDQAYMALTDGLRVAGFAVSDVRAVLATHAHMDHYGLAERVRAESGAWIGLHTEELAAIRDPTDADAQQATARDAQNLRDRLGVPPAPPRPGPALFQTARPDVVLTDGCAPPLPGWDLTTIWAPGHTPGHACFHDRASSLLFSGDHVLPRITPLVAVTTYQRPDPIGDYRSALDKVADLEVTEVLPAHEYRFSGLRDRVRELQDHVTGRLDEVETVLAAAPGATAWAVARALSWSRPFETLPPFHVRNAVGETLACLLHLEHSGRITHDGESPQRWLSLS